MSFAERTLGVWLNAALGFFYPEVCQFCGTSRATPSQGYVCASCRREVRFVEPPYCQTCGLPFQGSFTTPFECRNCRGIERHFLYARSAVIAQDLVLESIHRYKYNRALWLEPFLADLLLSKAAPELLPEEWDRIVPVPLHFTKWREREFNQAERLARRLAQATGIPVDARLLRRTKPTETQTRLSREAREANVRNAFELRRPGNLEGLRIVLVDDVFTTGATTGACAQALKRAGAEDVCVWTVARGI